MGRFRTLELLGSGGMGQCFRAHDPLLGRDVALKLLRQHGVENVARLLREARLQAQIAHPNVCPVYEAGEADGQPFIAMQLVSGRTLGETLKELTLEQRVRVVAEAAEGVHAAHRLGLVHRDLKPGNIMVEPREVGWHPWVMDFGLARETAAPGLTATGQLLGTPAYMAPEQAAGDPVRIDRRTDVYALGATLYEALCGRPPYLGASALEVLVKVARDEAPTPLRRLEPSLPRDLEAVVTKAMEREPVRRYPSARAFADDLRRFLDGEPVTARGIGWAARLRRRARRHRVAVAWGAAALAAVLGSAAWGVTQWWQGERRAELARRFGEEVQSIEALARYSAMLPEHDIRDDREVLRRRMEGIARQADRLGKAGAAAGSYALGRGHLALDEPERAREQLERAWSAGYRAPGVAFALGEALGALYRRDLAAAQRIAEPELRQLRIAAVAEELGEPAAHFLRLGAGAEPVAQAYGKALLALIESRYGEGIERLRSAGAGPPWFYEGRRLLGDLHLAAGDARRDRGELDAAGEHYARAAAALEEGVAIAPSAPVLYEGLCSLALARVLLAVQGPGGHVEGLVEEGLAACRRALTVDPDRVEARALAAALHVRRSQAAMLGGGDPLGDLETAVELAQGGLDLVPDHHESLQQLGFAYRFRGQHEYQTGGDPEASLRRAQDAFDRLLAASPGHPAALNNLGGVHVYRVLHLTGKGEDAATAIEDALAALGRAVERAPELAAAHQNTGLVLRYQARERLGRGLDPLPSLESAAAASGRALELNPTLLSAWINVAAAHLERGTLLSERGHDARPAVEEALSALEQALAINPRLAPALNYRGATYLLAARVALRAGEDSTASLQQAAASFEDGLAANPRSGSGLSGRAEVHLLAARQAFLAGADGSKELEGALERIGQARAVLPASSEPMRLQAEAHLVAAEAARARGTDPRLLLEAALTAARAALEESPDEARLHLLAGRAATRVAAFGSAGEARRRELTEEASRYLEEAERLRPDLLEVREAREEWTELLAALRDHAAFRQRAVPLRALPRAHGGVRLERRPGGRRGL